jgi:putative ABC transport system permease protein
VRHALFLAWRSLAHHRGATAILVAAIALVLAAPLVLAVSARATRERWTERARATPLVVGRRGSPTDLVVSALHFAERAPDAVPFGEVARIETTGLARAIPLHVRFRAGGAPVVGTSLDYFPFRGLRVQTGRWMTRLGDAVLGARLAARERLGPGDVLRSSPRAALDLAGAPPLEMRVTGVLAPVGTPDDDAAFVDVKTAWVLEGLAHGHDDLAPGGPVPEHARVTQENAASFHFHGDAATFPLTAVIAVPPDERARTLLRGRYEAPGEAQQAVVPAAIVEDLLGTLTEARRTTSLVAIAGGTATLLVAGLVVALSVRLRRREFETLARLGASPSRVRLQVALEALLVLLAGGLLAALLAALAAFLGTGAGPGFPG